MIHNGTYLGTEKHEKNTEKYCCEKCDYSTSHSGLWKRHLNTKKHNGTKMVHDDTSKAQKSTNITTLETNSYICECGRSYKYHSGYYRHKSKCNFDVESKPEKSVSKTNKSDYREMYEQKLEENLELAHEIIRKQQKAIDEMTLATNQSNNNNSFNTINNNVQIYLSENCSGAMTLEDFVEKLQITMEDLKIAKSDAAKGLAQIVSNNLKPLALTDRPVHHVSKHEWFVKNEGGWKEDDGEKLLSETHAGLRKQWPNVFENSNPNWMKNDKLSNEYCEMAGMATKDLSVKEKNAAKKKISQSCTLDKKTT
jgi:hypothetical protein